MRHRFANFLLITLAALAVLVLLYFVVAPDDLEQQHQNELTLQLQWIPTAQFLGVYVAIHENYFAQEGLKVELLHGGPTVDPLRRLTDGDCNIAIATADQVIMRDHLARKGEIEGVSGLKALGVVFKRSVAVFMLHGQSQAESLSVLRNKRIGVYPNYDSDHILSALLQKAGIAKEEVSVVPFPQLADWFTKDLDIFPSYLFNEPIEAATRGVPFNLIDPQDFGVNFYSDTIVVTDEFLQTHPEPLRRFMTALRRGWSYAKANPKAAVEMMLNLEQAAILGRGGKTEALLEQAKANSVVKYLGDDSNLLVIDDQHWLSMVATLQTIGAIDDSYNPNPLLAAN